MEFEFDKFIKDLEKRNTDNVNKNRSLEEDVREQYLKRLRERKTRELPQNRTYWRR